LRVIDSSNFEKLTDKGISHIKKIVYSALEEDKRFKRRCNSVRTVYVIFPDHSVKPIKYIDDTLYWIGTDNEAYNRAKTRKTIKLDMRYLYIKYNYLEILWNYIPRSFGI
jgi:hypothetical protein